MINLLKREIYIAKRIISDTDDITRYQTPIKYRIDVRPTDGNTELQAYGERIYNMQTAIVDKRLYDNVFSEGDVAYLDGASPRGEAVNGYNANYVIKSVRVFYKTIAIYFEKIQK